MAPKLRLLLVLLILPTSMVYADAVTTLKARLQSLQSLQPISGTLIMQNTSIQGKDPPVTTKARLSMGVRDSPQGLELHFPAALMRKVRAEQTAHAKQPNTPEPTLDLLTGIDANQVGTMLSYAPTLLRRLDSAILLKQSTVTVGGKSRRLLEFKLPLKLSKQDQDGLQSYRGRMDIWLDRDGVPVAIQQDRSIKIRKFFVIHINADSSETGNLIIWKGRLVLSQVIKTTRISGIQTRKQIERYRFQPDTPGRLPPRSTQPTSAPSSSVAPATAISSSLSKPRRIEAAASRPS